MHLGGGVWDIHTHTCIYKKHAKGTCGLDRRREEETWETWEPQYIECSSTRADITSVPACRETPHDEKNYRHFGFKQFILYINIESFQNFA